MSHSTCLQWLHIYPQLSVFSSILSCCCILISHLSTAPVSSAPVLSAKGHSGPPSRVHTFSREINGLSLQSLPLSFFVICRHWLGGCLREGKRTLGHVRRPETDGRSSCVDKFRNWRVRLQCFLTKPDSGREQVEQMELSQTLLCVFECYNNTSVCAWGLFVHHHREQSDSFWFDLISLHPVEVSVGGLCTRCDSHPPAF